MIRCPYCHSHNVIALPLGDYLCLDCDEQFSEGERPSRRASQNIAQKVSGKILSFAIKRGPVHAEIDGTCFAPCKCPGCDASPIRLYQI